MKLYWMKDRNFRPIYLGPHVYPVAEAEAV
jgi:hypothetical protein